ncbi:MAG: hypothetical protein Q4C95_11905 [Planctomycetia bacterium]|nr:hypothetical protein [Planctomycetia bacterium]
MKHRTIEILIFLFLLSLVPSIGSGQTEENSQISSEILLTKSKNQNDILRFRYWMAPWDQIDHWPWGSSKYYPVKIETFEKWMAILELNDSLHNELNNKFNDPFHSSQFDPNEFVDSQTNETAKIDSLFLEAQLEETTFVQGTGTAKISAKEENSKPILWEPFALGYSFPELPDNNSMFIAQFPNGLNYLINPQNKEIQFSWSLNGKKDSLDNIHFDLNFVKTPIIQFVFVIPNHYEPVCSDGILQLLEKNDQSQKWILQLGGHYQTHLSLNSIQKENDIQKKIGYRQENRYLFQLTGTEIISQFAFDSSEVPLNELIVVLDQPLVPLSVEFNGKRQDALIQSQTSLLGTTRLRLKIPGKIVGSSSISDLKITSFASTPLKTTWRLPGIRILSDSDQLFWKDSISRLIVERPLIATFFENIDSAQISEATPIPQIALTNQLSAHSSEPLSKTKSETFAFRYFEPNATISIRLSEEEAKIRFSSVTESLFNPDEIHAKTHLMLTGNTDNCYQIQIPISSDWVIDSVQSSQQDQLFWELSEKDEFNIKTLIITLKKPLMPQEHFPVQLTASLLLPKSSYIDDPLEVRLLCPINFDSILFGEHFLSIHSESSYQVGLLKQNGQHLNEKTLQSLAITSSALLRDILTPLRQTVLFPLNDQSFSYQAILEKTTPNYSADINGTISIRNDELTEKWKIKCIPPTGSRVDRLVIAFVNRPLALIPENSTANIHLESNPNISTSTSSFSYSMLSNGQNETAFQNRSFISNKSNNWIRPVSYQSNILDSVDSAENVNQTKVDIPLTAQNNSENSVSFATDLKWNWSIATETNRAFHIAPLSEEEFQSFHFPEGTTAWELQLLTSRSVPFEINIARTSMIQEVQSIPLILFPETHSQTADIVVESPNLTPLQINSLRLTSFPAELPKENEYQTIEGTFRYQPEKLWDESAFPQLIIKKAENLFAGKSSKFVNSEKKLATNFNDSTPLDLQEKGLQDDSPGDSVHNPTKTTKDQAQNLNSSLNVSKNKAWCWFLRLDSQHGTEGLVRYYATFYIENHGQENVFFTLPKKMGFSSIHAVWIDGQRATWYPIFEANQNKINVFLPERKRFVSICLEYFLKDQPLQTKYSIDLLCPQSDLPTLSGTWGTWIPPEFIGFSNSRSNQNQKYFDSSNQLGMTFAKIDHLDLLSFLTFRSLFQNFSSSSQDQFRLLTTHFLTELGNQNSIQKILKQKQSSLNENTEITAEEKSFHSTSSTGNKNKLTWGDIFARKENYQFLFAESNLTEFARYLGTLATSSSFLGKNNETMNFASISGEPIRIYIDRFSMSRSQILPSSEIVWSNSHSLLGNGIGAMENSGLVILCIEPNILCITTSIAIAEYREMLSPLVSDRVWLVSDELFANRIRLFFQNNPNPRLIPAEFWTDNFSGPINPWSDSFQETRLLSTTPGWNICKTEMNVSDSKVFIMNRYHLTVVKGLAFLIVLLLTWRGPFANPISLILIIGVCGALINAMNDVLSVPFMFGVSGVLWGTLCSFGFYSIRSRYSLRYTSSTSVHVNVSDDEISDESHSGFVSLDKIPKEQLYSENSLYLLKQQTHIPDNINKIEKNSDQIDLTNKINLSNFSKNQDNQQQIDWQLSKSINESEMNKNQQTRSRIPGSLEKPKTSRKNETILSAPKKEMEHNDSNENVRSSRQLPVATPENFSENNKNDNQTQKINRNESSSERKPTNESSSHFPNKNNKGKVSLGILLFISTLFLSTQVLFSAGLILTNPQTDNISSKTDQTIVDPLLQEPYRVFVPIDKNQKPIKDSFVWVEDKFYEQLKQMIGQQQNEADDWQIVKANYEGSINYNSFTKTLSFFHLKVTYLIRLEKEQATIKLPMMPLAPDVNALFDKQPILPIFQEESNQKQNFPNFSTETTTETNVSENQLYQDQGNLVFEIENATPGLHSLELLLAMPQFNNLNETVQIVIPRVPDSRLELMIPNDAPKIQVEQNLGAISKNGSLLIAELGPVDRIVLRKQEEIGKKGQTSVEVEQLFRLRLRPTQTELLAQFRYRITGGKIKQLYIKTDQFFQYSDYCKCDEVEIESVERDEVQKDLICVTFKNSVSGNLTLLTQYVANNFSGIGQLRLPKINAVEARITRSWLGLFETANVECQKIPESDITTSAFQSVWNTPDEIPVAIYNLLQTNSSWSISIRLKPATLDVFEQLAFVFKTTQTDMTYIAEIQSTQDLFRCSFQTNSIFELDSIELNDEKGNKLDSPDYFQESGRLYLSFKTPLLGKFQLKIVGKTVSCLDKEMPLPTFSIDHSQETKKTVSIFRDHSIYLDLIKPATWVSASSIFSENETFSVENPLTESQPPLYLGSYNVPETELISAATVIIHYNLPIVTGEQLNILFQELNHRWAIVTQLSFEIENGEMDHFEIELDELCSGSVELNPSINMKEILQDKKRVLILKPSGPVRDHFEIQLRTFVSSTNESLRLPKIIFRPLENGNFSNFRTKILLPNRVFFDSLQWEVNGLERVEKTETTTISRPTNALSSIVLDNEKLIPKIVTDVSGMTETDFFEYLVTNDNYSASIVWGQKSSRVLEASNSFFIRNNGTFFASSVMDVAIAKKDSSVLFIPANYQILDFSIDGINQSMESLGNGRWNIPLNPLRYSCRLEITYSGSLASKTLRQSNQWFPFLNDSFRSINLSLPYLQDIPTTKNYWICAFETEETQTVPCLISQEKIGQKESLASERITIPSKETEFENGNWKIPIGYREASPILVRIQMENMDHLLNLLEWEANTFSNQKKDLVRWYSRWFHYWMNCQNDIEMQIYPNRESIVLSKEQKAAIFMSIAEKTNDHSSASSNPDESNLHITRFSDIIRESSMSNWNSLKNRHLKLVETLGLTSVYESLLPKKKQAVSPIALWRLNHPANINYLFGITNENVGQIVVIKPTNQYYQQASRISHLLLWGIITVGIIWAWRRKLGFQLFMKNAHFWMFNLGLILLLFFDPHFIGLFILAGVLLAKWKPLWKRNLKRP